MSNWTKGGRWNRATIYRYRDGDNGKLYHLCFYNDRNIDWEFEITQIIDNPDMVCMLYPFLDKVALLDQLDAWLENCEECTEAKWASIFSCPHPDGVKVEFHQ